MAINAENRQAEIADELSEVARTLAHSTRSVPHPAESYGLLGDLQAAQDALVQVYEQLATWHGAVVDGTHYNGEDGRGLKGVPAAGPDGHIAGLLKMAAASAAEAAALVSRAHSANGVVRWFDDAKNEEEV
ncbi:hypothetical protein [Cryobacterium sp. Y29]|uniref:hypothetical protein n=1 Tax=Cryobacterium sp. Y29 TaxID=2048285 RepID=UPI000CE441A3|nr:hypothetical protein [Cryobacterium sp. Y29]